MKLHTDLATWISSPERDLFGFSIPLTMQRPSISEHLKVLRDVGLVSERKQGRQRYYYLEGTPLREIQEWLAPYEWFWKDRITNLEILLAEENHE